MKPKKSTRADLRSRRVLFFEIGFIVAFAAAVITFSIGQAEKFVDTGYLPDYGDPVIELPPPTKQEPPKVKVKPLAYNATIIRVRKNWEIVPDQGDFPDPGDIVIEMPKPVVETPIDDIPPYVVSDMPTFQGGDISTFRNWVMKHLVYPRVALDNGMQGRVLLKFVVEKDGSVSGIEVDIAPDRSLADEAARVVGLSPKWEPGMHNGRPSRVAFVLPIEFRLDC